MSTLLYRIGKASYGKPWYFIIGWVAVLAAILTGVAVNGVRISTEFSLPGTPSQTVMDTLTREVPAAAGGNAQVVFTAPEGESLLDPANAGAIAQAADKINQVDHVIDPAIAAKAQAEAQAAAITAAQEKARAAVADAGGGAQAQEQAAAKVAAEAQAKQQAQAEAMATLSYGPLMLDEKTPVPGVLIADDGSAAMVTIQFDKQVQELPADVAGNVVAAAETASDGTDIRVLPSDTLKAFGMQFGPTEVIGLVIAGIILLLTLGSLVAAGLPILTALVGVGVGVGATFAMSSFVDMNSTTPTLAMMIGLAVGIDYALFVVNRQRRLIVREGLSAGEAAARAVGTAGTAVFFAGATVIIALCGLAVIGIGFLTVMALSAALTVACAVAIAISLLPALLGLVGERICSPKYRAKQSAHVAEKRTSLAEKYVGGLIKRRWVVIVASILGLGVLAIPMTSMRLDFPSGASSNIGTDSRDSYDAISKGFGSGFNGPLVTLAHHEDGTPFTPKQIEQLTAALNETDGVAMAQPLASSKDGGYAAFTVIPTTGPADEATKDLIHELRDPELLSQDGVVLGVTGFTAISIDIAAKLTSVFPLYILIIGGLSLIILLLVFRSIWVPVKATVGFILSLLAALGMTTAVFQWGWLHDLFGFDNGGPLISFMPIIVTGILFGLAMDYEMFLVSSMREAHIHGEKGRAAVRNGFDISSRVVVAAAAIMISVFASFIFGGEVMIKQMGFALAVGVLLDAFVVRLTLVPAVMAVLGERAWWLPTWLDKILPNLDVEGEKLLERLSENEPESTPAPEPVKAAAATQTPVQAKADEPKPKAKKGKSSAKKKAKKKKRKLARS